MRGARARCWREEGGGRREEGGGSSDRKMHNFASGVGDFGDELCKLPDCVLTGVAEVDGVRVVTFHERHEACHQVVHVLERPRRLAIPVDGNVLSLQRLRVPRVRQQAHAALQHYGTRAQRHYGTRALMHYSTTALQQRGSTPLQHERSAQRQARPAAGAARQEQPCACLM